MTFDHKEPAKWVTIFTRDWYWRERIEFCCNSTIVCAQHAIQFSGSFWWNKIEFHKILIVLFAFMISANRNLIVFFSFACANEERKETSEEINFGEVIVCDALHLNCNESSPFLFSPFFSFVDSFALIGSIKVLWVLLVTDRVRS